MCDAASRMDGPASGSQPDGTRSGPSKRRFLRTASAMAVPAGLAAAGAFSAWTPATAAARGKPPAPGRKGRTRLVLLGTAGGPVAWGSPRAGTSTAIAFEDRVYIVDLGLGSFQRLGMSDLAGGGPTNAALRNVRALFFTHMHSDHLADWPAVYATAHANVAGRTPPPIEVYGPGDRGVLPRVFPPGRQPPEVYHPQDPTPGITGMTTYLQHAFAGDLNDRSRDSNAPGPDRPIFNVHDIDISDVWTVDEAGIPPRLSAPIEIMEDGPVRVTATLVDHRPTAPGSPSGSTPPTDPSSSPATRRSARTSSISRKGRTSWSTRSSIRASPTRWSRNCPTRSRGRSGSTCSRRTPPSSRWAPRSWSRPASVTWS